MVIAGRDAAALASGLHAGGFKVGAGEIFSYDGLHV